MKLLVNIARTVVGILFIFSGLVKTIDPLGLTYKMEEFFEVWAGEGYAVPLMNWLHAHAFFFTIVIITLEVMLGVALLVGWSKKLVLNLLLLLMLFFTFLTSYVLLSGKIRSCGCFGDCIPLTPIQTFTKDIILLLLIVILLTGRKYIEPLFDSPVPFVLVVLCTAAALYLQAHVIKHLPLADCLPYKKGNNILELRKMPADAVPDKYSYSFVYEKNGVKKDFTADKLPDSTWKFADRKQTLVEKGKNNVPLINDFSLADSSGADITETVLNQPAYYLFFLNEIKADHSKWLDNFKAVLEKSKQQHMPLYVLTADTKQANLLLNVQHALNVPVYATDVTAIKTAARANPTLFIMKGPVVQAKYSWADMKKVR